MALSVNGRIGGDIGELVLREKLFDAETSGGKTESMAEDSKVELAIKIGGEADGAVSVA